MKYFILTLDNSCQFVPQISDPSINRTISKLFRDHQSFSALPEHLTIPVTTTEQTVWTDILVSPVLMISKDMLQVISIYGDLIHGKDIILLERKNMKIKTYCLVRFAHAEGNISFGLGENHSVITLNSGGKINKWSNIFQVSIHPNIYTVINLDLAESLLRRDLKGIGLEEVIICGI